MAQALSEASRDEPADAARRIERLASLCGPALDLDVQRADCYVRLGRLARGEDADGLRAGLFAEAHRLYRRYAAKNPLGASCALFMARVPFYEDWSRLITEQRLRKSPLAAPWGRDFVAATSEGLLWQPRHYGLLLLRGDMLYWGGEKQGARRDMMAASAIIEDALGQVAVPLVRATLYFELANANIRWDKEKALKAANQVFLERTNPSDPLVKEVHLKVHRIISRIKQLSKEQPKPPGPKAPGPPEAEENEPDEAPEEP
jgi:hypothetical protein